MCTNTLYRHIITTDIVTGKYQREDNNFFHLQILPETRDIILCNVTKYLCSKLKFTVTIAISIFLVILIKLLPEIHQKCE